MDAEGLKGCRCGAGARIPLPSWRLFVIGEMEPICGGLVRVPDKSDEQRTTSRGGEGGESEGLV
jgi:hypothetical protein